MGNPFGSFYVDKYGEANQIVVAQRIADKWGITKEDCMEFAIGSQQKAHKATEAGELWLRRLRDEAYVEIRLDAEPI